MSDHFTHETTGIQVDEYLSREISLYELTNGKISSSTTLTIGQYLDNCRSGKYRRKVNAIRNETDTDRQSELKNNLAVVMPQSTPCQSGKRKNGRGNGLLFLNFNEVEDMEAAKQKIADVPYVFAVGISMSGHEIFALTALTEAMENLEPVIAAMQTDFEIGIDPACSKITQLRYVTYAPDLIVKDVVTPFQFPVEGYADGQADTSGSAEHNSVAGNPETENSQHVGTIMRVKLSDIIIPETRLRAFDHDKMLELAESMNTIGLMQPPILDRNKRLVAGLHRIEAGRHLGRDTMECLVLDDDDPLRMELIEIEENFMRNELDPISAGEHAIRRDEILLQLGLRAKAGQGRPAKNGADSAPLKTTESIAKDAGMSKRTLQENKQLAKNLTNEAKNAIREKSIPKYASLELSRLAPEQQREIATLADKEAIVREIESKSQKTAKTKAEKSNRRVQQNERNDTSNATADIQDTVNTLLVLLNENNGIPHDIETLKETLAPLRDKIFAIYGYRYGDEEGEYDWGDDDVREDDD